MKKITSLFLVLSMLIVSLCVTVPVYAKQDFSFSTNFDDYVGTWNGTTVTAEGSLPTGTFVTESALSEVCGVTSVADPAGKYGTSVKVYSAYSETIKSTAGLKFDLKKANYQLYSAYIESSIYAVEPEDGSKTPRSIRVHGLNDAGTSSTQILALALLDNKKMSLMGVSSDTEWNFGTWYDMKAWMNIYTGEYKVEVWSNGSFVTESSGVSEAVENFKEIRTVSFLNNAHTQHSTYMKGKDPQITYFDNLKVESIYKFHVDKKEDASHLRVDFENFTSAEQLKTDLASWGTFVYEAPHEYIPAETDRGTSLRLKPLVWTGAIGQGTDKTQADYYAALDEDGNVVYNRSQMLYPGFRFDTKSSTHVGDAAYFKISFKPEDANYGSFSIELSASSRYTAISMPPNGQVALFGKQTGIWFEIGVWYDVEGIVDLDTGYYTVSLKKGNEQFETTGYVVPVHIKDARYDYINRFKIQYWNRAKANDWSLPTSMLFDDIQFGKVEKLKGAVANSYAFTNATDMEKFVTTGGISAIIDDALKVTGAVDGETATTVSMAMPFIDTTFKYDADITLGDLSADRVLSVRKSVSNKTAAHVFESTDVLKFGADGKLYIGGNEIADVTVSNGTYHIDAVFNQENYTASITVSKDGTEIATADAALGTATVRIMYLDWNIGAGAETVTSFDNVSYSTIFAFEMDETKSTTGEKLYVASADDVVVKFSNAIDKTSFTADTVSVNNGAIAVTGFAFVDDYTVKIGFDKNQGTHYHVNFTVNDIYGNTLTDYIEFNTVRQDLEMSAISFKKGDKALSLVESGDITVNFTAKANNGTSYDMLFMAGLYQGGRLVDSDFESFTVGEERKPHTLNLTVPDDGKLYILKGFVWDAETGAPYCEPAVLEALSADTKVALVKFDDLNTNNIDKFVDIANWAEENDVKMNFIFMVMYFDPDREKGSLCDETDIKKMQDMYNSSYIELTSHGYYGGTSFFGVSSLEDQLDDFANVKRTTENMGMTITSMAPPNNAVNADTVKAFNQYPEYKALMVRQSNDATLNANGFFNEENGFETFWKYIDVEVGSTGNTDTVENLKTKWNAAMDKGYDYVMLQAHPGGWADGGAPETNMYEFLLWLKSQGVVFMHATEYAEYVSAL